VDETRGDHPTISDGVQATYGTLVWGSPMFHPFPRFPYFSRARSSLPHVSSNDRFDITVFTRVSALAALMQLYRDHVWIN
jgi:hypothetical protein